VEDFKLA